MMSNCFRALGAAALALSLAGPVVAQDTPDADTVVATVNGAEITLGHMILVRASLPAEYQQLPADALYNGILQQLIQQTALSQQDTATESKRVTLALDNERRALLASEAIATELKDTLTDEALQAAYEERFGDFDAGTEYNASHILVETEEEAQAIVSELEGGADFADLARERSTGPSGPGGGSLGWFGPGRMVPAFEEAVTALQPEEISGPVQTQFGWHVIRLNEVRDTEAPSLEDVREELSNEIQNAEATAFIDRVVENAEIETAEAGSIDPALLAQIELLDD